ncbi:MAG: homocysteine S-methyltransferase family protein [Caldilineaceae bacterium]
MAVAADAANVVAVGVNCTPPRYVEPLLRSVAGPRTRCLTYPNSGEQWDAGQVLAARHRRSVRRARLWYARARGSRRLLPHHARRRSRHGPCAAGRTRRALTPVIQTCTVEAAS